jgi:hypothetical protein
MKNLYKVFYALLCIVFLSHGAYSQMAISVLGTADPDPSAILDLQSTNMGFLTTRMTAAEIAAIPSPATGLMVFQTDGTPGFYYNTGTPTVPVWNRITDDTTPIGYWTQVGSDIYYSTGNVGIGIAAPTVPLDVSGAARITGALQLSNGATNNYVLVSDASGNASWQDVNPLVTNDGDWTVDGNDIYNQNSGNIGIGTATPAAKLDVQGSAIITGALQFSNGATDGYVLTSDASGNATWAAAPGGADGDWTINGNDIYSAVSGNVGIGTSAPATKLDVTGPGHFLDSLYVDGRPGRLFLNGQTNFEPTIRYAYEGSTIFKQKYRLGDVTLGDPYFMLDSYVSPDIFGITAWGRMRLEYVGATTASLIYSAGDGSAQYINNSSTGSSARGINVSISSTSSAALSLGIGAWNNGGGDAIYGQNTDIGTFGYLGTTSHGAYGQYGVVSGSSNFGTLGTTNFGAYGEHGSTDNRGHLGGEDFGAYGISGGPEFWGALGVDGTDDWGVYGSEAGTDPNFGGIGTDDYGVYGEYNTENFWGALGTSTAGVYGRLGGSTQDVANGDYAVKGIGIENSGEAGTGYAYNANIGGVMGYNVEGTPYSFGVAGFTETANERRSAAILGSNIAGTLWGSIAYYPSTGGRVAGYFTTAITQSGSGKAATQPIVNIGISSYGDLFGAYVNGNIYGLYAEGTDYSIFADGDMYRTGADVHLQRNESGQNTVMYTLVTPEMTVQTYGIGNLQNGKSNIVFDQAFADVVSEGEPIIVTITPIGQTKGVFLERVDGAGFAVAENNQGKSNVQFSWIAIGKRKGFDMIELPESVVAADYTEKISRGLHNDIDNSTDGEGLYYQNGKLYNGHALISSPANSSIPESARKLEAIDAAGKSSLVKPAAEREEADVSEKDVEKK